MESYKSLQREFERLWLAEDCDNTNFRNLLGWFDQTIKPCEQKLREIGAH